MTADDLDLDYGTAQQLIDCMNAGTICGACGEPYMVDVLEYWPEDRAFLLDTCCEGSHEEATEAMREWKRADWNLWFDAMAGVAVRDVHIGFEKGDGGWTMDFGLELREIAQADAFDFIERHHRHNERPTGWRWGHAVYNGPDLVAVAVVGNPKARMLNGRGVVEITRLCVDPTLPAGVVEHACSKLYGAAAREAEKRGWQRIITYTLETESAVSVKAAGYAAEAETEGGSWDRPSRPRRDTAPTCPKVRWARTLRPAARAVRALELQLAERAERNARAKARRQLAA